MRRRLDRVTTTRPVPLVTAVTSTDITTTAVTMMSIIITETNVRFQTLAPAAIHCGVTHFTTLQ